MPNGLFRPRQNCAEVAHANRVAFVVDAENYFRDFMLACQRRSANPHPRLGLRQPHRALLTTAGRPAVVLGDFLNGLARRNRRLRIRILDWDFSAGVRHDRERLLTLTGSWRPHRRIDFRYDDTHPFAGSHHQKVVVIDDKVAFSGGLDLTNRRWDSREHEARDPRRTFDGEPYAPVHDVMIAVDGEAAKALARVARQRWRAATGETAEARLVGRRIRGPRASVDLTDIDGRDRVHRAADDRS
jgi:phosphatidylserine/phosphatidylglycerophosphate/cardiolipin synthase-like enzyme